MRTKHLPKQPPKYRDEVPDLYVHRVANGFYVEGFSDYDVTRQTCFVFTSYRTLANALVIWDGGRSFVMNASDDPGWTSKMFRPKNITECIKILKTRHARKAVEE